MHLLRLLFLSGSLEGSSGLLLLLLLEEEKGVDLIGDVVATGDDTRDLLTANEGGNDASTDNKGQDEAVHAVPVRSKALDGSPGVVVVEESEG